MASADHLTVLLTLKDRASFTARWMAYMNSVKAPVKVLIADGGSDDRSGRLLAHKENFPNVDYEYVRYPEDRTYDDYYSKVVDALERIRTPFVVFADNDDFFVPRRLVEAVDFLLAHPDYIACGGQGAIFWSPSSSRDRNATPLYGDNIAWKSTYETTSQDARSAKERLFSAATSKSDTSFYDVKRIEEVRRQFTIVESMKFADLFFTEFVAKFLTAVQGKSKRLEELYLVRQHDAVSSSGLTHIEQHGDWFGRMLLKTWSSDFAKFAATVGAALAEVDGISAEEAKDTVVKCYRMMVAPSLLSNILEEPTITFRMATVVPVVRRLVNLTEHNALKRIARTLYRHSTWISPYAVYGQEILSTPVSHARRDIEPILHFLRGTEPAYAVGGVLDA